MAWNKVPRASKKEMGILEVCFESILSEPMYNSHYIHHNEHRAPVS